MCLSPVHVISPKFRAGTFINGADRISIDVPCGHCPECTNKRVNDLVFRCYHEYLDTEDCRKKNGYGFTLFQTLTYSMLNTPYHEGFRFFCKTDLQKFLKRIRKRLDLLGYDVSNNLKYIITCEYGSSDKGMHLPHYHPLFFSKVPHLTPYVLDQVIHDSWKNLGDEFTDSLELGFVDRRDTDLRVVNSIYGIRYVCKYVYKGTSVKDALDYNRSSSITKFVKDFCVQYGHRYAKDGKFKWSYNDLKDWQIARIWKCYKCYFPQVEGYELMPFYLQSKGLGMRFLELSSVEELMDVVQLPANNPKGFINFSVPLYYIRKAFYDYDKDSKRFILNGFGKEFKQKVSRNMCESYDDMRKLNKELLNSISIRLFGIGYDNLVQSHLNGRDYHDFVYYAVYLKDRQVPPELSFLFDWHSNNGWDLSPDIDIPTYALEFEENALNQQVADSPNWSCERFIKWKFDSIFPQNSLFDVSNDILTNKKTRQISYPLHNVLVRFNGFDDLYYKLQKIKYEFTLARNLKMNDEYKFEKGKALARSVTSPQNSIIY
jgi:hypothetical protein